jgi:aminopeptidase
MDQSRIYYAPPTWSRTGSFSQLALTEYHGTGLNTRMTSPSLPSSSFDAAFGIDAELKLAAHTAISVSLKVQPGEKVLIVTNPDKEAMTISYALFDAVLEARGRPSLFVQPVKAQLDYAEDALIAAFESQPDVVLSISAEKLGKDRSGLETPYEWDDVSYDHVFDYQLHGAKTLRACWSPRITRESFIRTVPIDYAELRARCRRVKEVLDKAVSVHVVNAKGTDITVGAKGRKAFSDDGDFAAPGSGGNLPAGEVFLSPELGTSNGTIAFDGSISCAVGDLIIGEPVIVTVKNGFAAAVAGGPEADEVRKSLEAGEMSARKMSAEGRIPPEKGALYARNAKSLGELGIGLNPSARITGNMLEDEKAFHTCHFALGANYDEDAPALVHFDGLVTAPTITAVMPDGKEVVILRDGTLLL